VAIIAAALCGCDDRRQEAATGHATGTASTAVAIVPVDESLTELRRWFGAHEGHPRFVTLLSPTCPGCLDGARQVRDRLLGGKLQRNWAFAVVWVPMRPTDTTAAMHAASRGFAGLPIRQFHDPDKVAARAFARAIAPRLDAPAWDVFLFYATDAAWTAGDPPKPKHGLGQYLGPRGEHLVGDGVDANLRPTRVGTAAELGALLWERAAHLDR